MRKLAALLITILVMAVLAVGSAHAYVLIEPSDGKNPKFGKVRVGKSKTQDLTIVNHSSNSETVELISSECRDTNYSYGSSPAFDCIHDLGGVELAPGESTTLTVTFEPPSRGFWQADLYVTDASGDVYGVTSPYGKGISRRGNR